MKLKDYINSNGIDFSEQIFLSKFEELFRDLSLNDDVVFYIANHHKTTDDLIKIFENVRLKKTPTKLLMINPDIDFPFIKKNFIDVIENEKYDSNVQSFWERQPVDYFLNFEILNLIPENLQIYCHANIAEHSQVTMIPIGRDFKGLNYLTNNPNYTIKKQNLCYLNLSTPPNDWHWYGRIRQHISDFADKTYWILKENTQPNYGRNIHNNFMNYYEKLKISKFMIAPRGCGLDTYRLWDALYFGCVPIAVNYSRKTGYNRLEDLPIYYLDSWEEYLSLNPQKLEDVWETMLEKDYNFEKLKFSYWENLIKK